jgi:hypothetical protein
LIRSRNLPMLRTMGHKWHTRPRSGGHSSSQKKKKWCPTKINSGVNRCPWAINFANACYSWLAGGDGFVEGGTGLTGC